MLRLRPLLKSPTGGASSDKKSENSSVESSEEKKTEDKKTESDKKSESTDKKADSESESTDKKSEDASEETSSKTASINKKEESKTEDKTTDKKSEDSKSDDSTENATDATTESTDKASTETAESKKTQVTKAAALQASYICEDGEVLYGTINVTGDAFAVSDKAKSIDGYTLATVTLNGSEIGQDVAFTKESQTTETGTEIVTETSYAYSGSNGVSGTIAAGENGTLTYIYHQDAQPVAVNVTTKAVDTTGAVIEGAKTATYSIGENDVKADAPVIQGYTFVKATLNGAEIKTVTKKALDGQYEFYVDGAQVTADSEDRKSVV